MTDAVDLGEFDDRPIVGTAIKLTGTGDGLSKALAVDPIKLQVHEDVYLLVRGRVHHFEYRPVDDDAEPDDLEWTEIAVAKAMAMTVPEGMDVAALIEAQIARNADRTEAAKEAAKQAEADALRESERASGVQHLPGTAEALEDDHLEGKHSGGVVEDCPLCDWEGAVAASEEGGES